MSTQSTVSQVVLKAKQDALQQDIGTELGRMGKKEITGEEFSRRRTALEGAYNVWYAGFEKNRGATPEETSQVRQSYAAQQAQATEATATQLLQAVLSGEISQSKYESQIKYLERGHSTRVGQILGGSYDRFHYGSPIAYRTTFREAEAQDTPIFRDPTEAEIDTHGAQQAEILSQERGYEVGYDSGLNQIFWSRQDEDKYYADRDPLEGDTQHRIGERRWTDAATKYRGSSLRQEDILTNLGEIEKGWATQHESAMGIQVKPGEFTLKDAIETTILRGGKQKFVFQNDDLFPTVKLAKETAKIIHDVYERPFLDISGGMRTKSVELKGEGDLLSSLFYRSGAMAFDVATWGLRPIQKLSVAAQYGGLLVSSQHRGAVAEGIQQDPLGFGVDVVTALGTSYLLHKAPSFLERKISKYRTDKFLENYPAEDFLPYEEQFRYPQEVTILEDRTVLFKESVRVTDDLGSGSFEPYLTPRGSWPSKGMGYRRTGEGLVQEFIPEGMGHIETWIKPVTYKGIMGSEFLSGIRVSGDPLFSFSSASNLGLLASLEGAQSVLSTFSDLSLKTETITEQALIPNAKGKYQTWLKPVTYTDLVNVNVSGLRIDVTQPQITKLKDEETFSIKTPASFPNMLDTKHKQKQDLFQDITQTQIPDQIPELVPKQIQKQEAILDPIGLTIQEGRGADPFRVPSIFTEKGKRKGLDIDPMGWEMREYPVRDIEELIGWEPKITKMVEPKDILGLGSNTKLNSTLDTLLGVKPSKSKRSKGLDGLLETGRRRRGSSSILDVKPPKGFDDLLFGKKKRTRRAPAKKTSKRKPAKKKKKTSRKRRKKDPFAGFLL